MPDDPYSPVPDVLLVMVCKFCGHSNTAHRAWPTGRGCDCYDCDCDQALALTPSRYVPLLEAVPEGGFPRCWLVCTMPTIRDPERP